ncbi:MAG: helix-turn-helix transcriptional regulator [Lewinellaceae bacterium]|nr:helix-turn-helix transcriptional regulator [Phaeodactylibacter sp.]MCB9352723.1 helix-turn-helix transcriptional regulator [Lewinellaceae bacterium]
MYLSNNIKALRKKQGYTQESLSKELGKTKATVSDYEKGKSLPPLDILLKMCALFQINLEDLVNKDLEKEGVIPEQSPSQNTSAPPSPELLNRLLVQKLEEVAEELKENYPEAYRKLRLEELIRKGK